MFNYNFKMSQIVTTAFLLNAIFPLASAVAQVDFRLGDRDFFIGEKFLIGIGDIIWWFAGMTVGAIIAMTFIVIKEFLGFKRRMDIEAESREGRLIGFEKYPTQMEERVFRAIHTQPDNYFDGKAASRRGRLIGSWKYPTQLEHLVLKRVDSEPDNYNLEVEGTQSRQPRRAGRAYSPQMNVRNFKPRNEEPQPHNYFDGDINNKSRS